MKVYAIGMFSGNEEYRDFRNAVPRGRGLGPSIGEILAVRLSWKGIIRRFRKMDWRQEILDHLIFIDERDIFEAVDVKIEELDNTQKDKDSIPHIRVLVDYGVMDKERNVLVGYIKREILLGVVLDAKI